MEINDFLIGIASVGFGDDDDDDDDNEEEEEEEFEVLSWLSSLLLLTSSTNISVSYIVCLSMTEKIAWDLDELWFISVDAVVLAIVPFLSNLYKENIRRWWFK